MQMQNIPNVPLPFSIVVLLHFFFVSNALLTADFYQWIPSYLFTHVVLILFGLWASHDKKGLEPVLAYIVAIAMTMLNDIILLGLYFSDSQDNADTYARKPRNTWHYSAAMVIIHLIIKVSSVDTQHKQYNCLF